ncbi:tetratricopeptide repeat protein [Streptomyces albogriseolus]|uniref:tetratricopeptide repeat protein n=1 Tax=Streptomyces albogriseolus TaxID=1887 RepID=UPI003460DA59
MSVTDTGNATAAPGAAAVTGYRGPAPGTDGAPAVVRVSGTGDAIAEGGIANTGYLNVDTLTVVQQRAAPREPASWPHQVGVIPPQARSFQHRAQVDQLHAAVDSGGSAVLNHVLTGMGGVGKTQLAADYARTAWDDGTVDVLVWVTASTRSAVVTGYAQAGVELSRADPDNAEQAAQTFLAWLSPKAGAKPCRWLIVLDNVTDPNDLRGMWPPDSPHGRTLITTRRRDDALTGHARAITVGLYTLQEALSYLTKALASRGREEPKDELEGLAKDLGCLPLALSQAVAYIIDASLNCAEYRALLADRTARLEDLEPDALPDDQPHAVHAAWSLSIDRANQLKPAGLAQHMLRLTAVLDSDGIPETVLTSQPALDYLSAADTAVTKAVTEREARRCLRALHHLSLIDHNPETSDHAVRVHQLIQRAVRESEPPDQYAQTIRAAADALHSAWPPATGSNTEIDPVLRACAWSLLDYGRANLFEGRVHPVLFRWGQSLSAIGPLVDTMGFFEGLEHRSNQLLGPRHRDTLAIRGVIAELLRQFEAPGAAVDELQEVLTTQIDAFGVEDPDVFTTRLRLAQCQADAGDTESAIITCEQLLNDEIRIHGASHENALVVRHRLAVCKAQSGLTEAAVADYEGLLVDYLRIFGAIDGRTFDLRTNLATCHARSGNFAQAINSYEQLLSDLEQAPGPVNEQLINVLDVLSYCQAKMADWASAIATLERLIPLAEAHWGADHSNIDAFRYALASCTDASGVTSDARSMWITKHIAPPNAAEG